MHAFPILWDTPNLWLCHFPATPQRLLFLMQEAQQEKSGDSGLSLALILLCSIGQVSPALCALSNGRGTGWGPMLFPLSHCAALPLFLGLAAEEVGLKLGASSSVWPLLLPPCSSVPGSLLFLKRFSNFSEHPNLWAPPPEILIQSSWVVPKSLHL